MQCTCTQLNSYETVLSSSTMICRVILLSISLVQMQTQQLMCFRRDRAPRLRFVFSGRFPLGLMLAAIGQQVVHRHGVGRLRHEWARRVDQQKSSNEINEVSKVRADIKQQRCRIR